MVRVASHFPIASALYVDALVNGVKWPNLALTLTKSNLKISS